MIAPWIVWIRRAFRGLVILLGLLVVFGAVVSIPVMREMEIRREVGEVFRFGQGLLRKLAAEYVDSGRWPADPLTVRPVEREDWLPQVKEVSRLGRTGFRLRAEDPEVLDEHPMELQLLIVEGRLAGSCSVPGVKDRLLPAACRKQAGTFPVRTGNGG